MLLKLFRRRMYMQEASCILNGLLKWDTLSIKVRSLTWSFLILWYPKVAFIFEIQMLLRRQSITLLLFYFLYHLGPLWGEKAMCQHIHACSSIENQFYLSEALLVPLEKQLSWIIDLFWSGSCVSFIYMKGRIRGKKMPMASVLRKSVYAENIHRRPGSIVCDLLFSIFRKMFILDNECCPFCSWNSFVHYTWLSRDG